jgi:hypothetical protein
LCYTSSMKQLILALLLISTTAWADTGSGAELATPIGHTGLLRTVLVEGAGPTPTLARQDAFRMALERTVGTGTGVPARISNFAVALVGQRGSLYYTQVWVTVTN